MSAGYASIQVKALIEPGDEDTKWWAETSRDNENWSGSPGVMGEYPAHAGPQTVEFDLKDEKGDPTKFLLGNTRYYVRVVLSNGVKETFSATPNPTLITLPVDPPKVLSVDSATEISYTVAKLSGSVERPANVDPAFDAHCSFDYVSHSQFIVSGFKKASNKPCAVTPLSTPGANPVSANLTGLKPGAVYHFRLNAVNAGGLSTMVAANTFTTTAITPPVATVANPVLGIGTAAHFSGTINPEKGPADPALYDVSWRFECTPKCLDARRQSPDRAGDSSRQLRTRGRRRRHPRTEHRISGQARRLQRRRDRHRGPGLRLDSRIARGRPDPGRQRHRRFGNAWREDQPAQLTRVLPVRMGPRGQPYENEAPLAPEQLARADNAYHFVGAPPHRPSPGTTYHYRVIATNTLLDQQTIGADRTFTTLAAAAAPRPAKT